MKHCTIILLSLLILSSCIKNDKSADNKRLAIEMTKQANEQYVHGNLDSALILADSAIVLDETYVPSYNTKVSIYIARNKMQKVFNTYVQLLRFEPDNTDALVLVGAVYDAKGDSAKAAINYKKALECYEKNIADPNLKDQALTNRINHAALLILSGKEAEGKAALMVIKNEKHPNVSVDNLLLMTRQLYLDQYRKKK